MRSLVITVPLAAVLFGCGPTAPTAYGPTVPAFPGKVVRDGQPLAVPPGFGAEVKLTHAESRAGFDVPLDAAGRFKIGWMPVGHYTGVLAVVPHGGGAGGTTEPIEPFEITPPGNAEYTVTVPPTKTKPADPPKRSD